MSDRFAYHSSMFNQQYSKEENRKFTEQFGALTERFANAMKEGKLPESERVQQLVKEHYEFCLQFWKPTREAYKSLAMSYILPSSYRDSYESVAIGLGKYHYEAILIWAEKNLTD
jgi:hypothetical protein